MRIEEEATRPGVSAPLAGGPRHSSQNVSSEDVSYNLKGQVTGCYKGAVLKKRVSSKKHFLRKPPAICWDVQVIEEAKERGTKHLEVEDIDSGQVYFAPLITFLRHGFEFDRGHGRQMGLTLTYWGIKDPRQPTLSGV